MRDAGGQLAERGKLLRLDEAVLRGPQILQRGFHVLNKRAFSIATADCAANVLIRSTVFCGKAPGVRRRTTSRPTISSPRSSGATNTARKPARRMISLTADGSFLLQVGDLDRLALREGLSDVRLIKADALLRQRVNQLLIHAVGGAQMKFALQHRRRHRSRRPRCRRAAPPWRRWWRARFRDRASSSPPATLRRARAAPRPSGQVHRCAGAIHRAAARSRWR